MEETPFSLRLLVDEKRNKVVLAEACRDFVDVLFSLLTLPMGTIVRLLQKHKQQPMRLGCFNNIYKSVSDMTIDDFETEACRTMLLYPRSIKEIHCRRLKLNIDDTEATKFFTCPLFPRSCKKYSNFNTSRCSCGDLMTREFQVSEEDQLGSPIGNNDDGVFVSCRSSYIVTDDLRVTLSSLGVISKELNLLGYADFDDVKEILLDAGIKEVLTLLGNFFASDFPLSRTFLGKDFLKRPSTHTLEVGCGKGGHECNVKIFVRKSDKKIIYAECSEDFIDSLLGILALPLELAWSLLSNNGSVLGCVGNLCRSECREASSASTPLEVPYYYTCSKQVLDIPSQPTVVYFKLYTLGPAPPVLSFVRNVKNLKSKPLRSLGVIPMDPKVKSETPSKYSFGFVKRDMRFIVSDDMVITPMSSSSTIGLFMKSKINNTSDLEEQEISISKAEVCL
ncbi:PREDICTED: uncharacterized protein LOC106292390 [Brassica oleracea var. oleracea]|uniref:uncharacterized protein LOC106292390 n=1 Tax=Brassica oleracea var. oleracea TaxID=109376 RepID=UPI0006A7470B|nr:PREDICTED: uncharacterized protein LOC106292390 [Brassica oleracea var. oleracea]